MRCLLLFAILFSSPAILADSMPIRGATGAGYGQFSWGTSVATVEKMSPKLAAHEEEARTRFERSARKELLQADHAMKRKKRKASLARTPRGKRRFKSYRHWVKMAGLDGRVTLSFYKDQLFEVSVGLLYPLKKTSNGIEIIEALIEKYGQVLPNAEGQIPKSTAPMLSLKIEGGQLTIFRTKAKSKTTGYLKLLYESERFGMESDQYLTDLRARVSNLKTMRSRARNGRGKDARKRRQKRLMDKL